MSLLAFSLVLLAAVLHASWNLVVKASGGGKVLSFYSALAVTVLWGPLNVGLWIAYPATSPLHWSNVAWLVIGASSVVHALYIACLFHGYEVAPLSVVYPVARGIAPLLSAVAAVFVFSERLTLASGCGIAAITAGVIILTWRGNVEAEERARISKGVFWGAVTGLTIAFYTLLDGYAVKVLDLSPLSVDYGATVPRAPLLLPFILRGRRPVMTTAHRKAIAAIVLLGPTAYILVLFAMRLAPLSHVAPAREVSLLLGVFLSGHFLEEGERGKRIVAAMLIAGGVMALTVPH